MSLTTLLKINTPLEAQAPAYSELAYGVNGQDLTVTEHDISVAKLSNIQLNDFICYSHSEICEVTSVKNNGRKRVINATPYNTLTSFTKTQQLILENIGYHYTALPTVHNAQYFTVVQHDQNAISTQPYNIQHLSDTPQTNDIIAFHGKRYRINSICWYIALDTTHGDSVRAYLIISKIDETEARHDQIYANNPWMKSHYKNYKTKVMAHYNSNNNISQRMSEYFKNTARIRTFIDGGLKRSAQNASIYMSAYGVQHLGTAFIPLVYVHSIWSFGVSEASRHIMNYFDKSRSGELSDPSSKLEGGHYNLQRWVRDCEFKVERFTKRLNLIYWEMMETYQKLILEDQKIAIKEHKVGKDFLPARANQQDGFNYNYVKLETLIDETSEYAGFIQNVVKTMEKDLHLIKNSVEMKKIRKRFEKLNELTKISGLHYRKPVDMSKIPSYSEMLQSRP